MNYYVIHPFTISTQPIFLLPLLYAISGKLETKYSTHYALNWNGWIDWRLLSKLCVYHDMNIHLCLKENVSLVIPTFVNLGSLCWKERNTCSIRKKARRSLTLSSFLFISTFHVFSILFLITLYHPVGVDVGLVWPSSYSQVIKELRQEMDAMLSAPRFIPFFSPV